MKKKLARVQISESLLIELFRIPDGFEIIDFKKSNRLGIYEMIVEQIDLDNNNMSLLDVNEGSEIPMAKLSIDVNKKHARITQ